MKARQHLHWAALLILACMACDAMAADPKLASGNNCTDTVSTEKRWQSLVKTEALVPNGPTNTPTDTQVEAVQRFLLGND